MPARATSARASTHGGADESGASHTDAAVFDSDAAIDRFVEVESPTARYLRALQSQLSSVERRVDELRAAADRESALPQSAGSSKSRADETDSDEEDASGNAPIPDWEDDNDDGENDDDEEEDDDDYDEEDAEAVWNAYRRPAASAGEDDIDDQLEGLGEEEDEDEEETGTEADDGDDEDKNEDFDEDGNGYGGGDNELDSDFDNDAAAVPEFGDRYWDDGGPPHADASAAPSASQKSAAKSSPSTAASDRGGDGDGAIPPLLFEVNDDGDIMRLDAAAVDRLVRRRRAVARCLPFDALVQSCDVRASDDGCLDAVALRRVLADVRPRFLPVDANDSSSFPSSASQARVWQSMERLFQLCDPQPTPPHVLQQRHMASEHERIAQRLASERQQEQREQNDIMLGGGGGGGSEAHDPSSPSSSAADASPDALTPPARAHVHSPTHRHLQIPATFVSPASFVFASAASPQSSQSDASPSAVDHDHGRVECVEWLAAALFLSHAPYAAKLALAFALADAQVQESLDARQLMTLFRGMALALFALHDEMVAASPLQMVQDMALRAARIALETCFEDCGLALDQDERVTHAQLVEWLCHSPKGAFNLWLHLLDVDSDASSGDTR